MRKKTAYKLLLIKTLIKMDKPKFEMNYLSNLKNKLINFFYYFYIKIF